MRVPRTPETCTAADSISTGINARLINLNAKRSEIRILLCNALPGSDENQTVEEAMERLDEPQLRLLFPGALESLKDIKTNVWFIGSQKRITAQLAQLMFLKAITNRTLTELIDLHGQRAHPTEINDMMISNITEDSDTIDSNIEECNDRIDKNIKVYNDLRDLRGQSTHLMRVKAEMDSRRTRLSNYMPNIAGWALLSILIAIISFLCISWFS